MLCLSLVSINLVEYSFLMTTPSDSSSAKKTSSFGSTRNYLIATAAELTAGPFFALSPLVMLLTDKGKATKDWPNAKKLWAWAIAGVMLLLSHLVL